MNPTVLNLTGSSGVGKSYFLEKFRDSNPGSIQILTPAIQGEKFSSHAIDWDGHAGVALDEVLKWDRTSLVEGVAALEAYAQQHDKILILVTQHDMDLEIAGVQLRTIPIKVCLHGRQESIDLSYDGRHLRFSAIAKDVQEESQVR